MTTPHNSAAPQTAAEAMALIRQAVRDAWRRACRHYGLGPLPEPTLDFSLRGKMAGQAGWRVKSLGRRKQAQDFRLRFNLEAYALHPADMLDDTVPHEIAHLVVVARFGPGRKPHGPEWQEVMRECFGLAPRRTHQLALTPARNVERCFIYACKCREHQLTSIRHERVRRGRSIYSCKSCGEMLRFQELLPDPI